MTVGKNHVVTGAASGIGQAIALRLAEQGHSLALLDRDAEGLALTAKNARSRGAEKVMKRTVDVASAGAVHVAFAAAERELGGLDGLASAAGILIPGGIGDTAESDWTHHLAVNAGGVFHCLQAAASRMRDGGAVVVVSSNAARVPRGGLLAYSASKAAASAVTRSAGLELAARRIRCNVVEPGSTDTPMQRDVWPDPEIGTRAAIEGDPEAYRIGIPLGRIADPDDVAAMVCFLLSDDARHVTLQQIYVDGGASL